MSSGEHKERVFKTAWFARAARKARINDQELCLAVAEVMQGQADDLGGGVFKSRWAKTYTAASSLRAAVATGSTNICSRKKIALISRTMNLPPFANLRRLTIGSLNSSSHS